MYSDGFVESFGSLLVLLRSGFDIVATSFNWGLEIVLCFASIGIEVFVAINPFTLWLGPDWIFLVPLTTCNVSFPTSTPTTEEFPLFKTEIFWANTSSNEQFIEVMQTSATKKFIKDTRNFIVWLTRFNFKKSKWPIF